MIRTEPRAETEVFALIPPGEPVGLVGCGDCAAALGTGGTRQVDEWSKRFSERNPVVFATVMGSPCDQRVLRRLLPLIPRFNDARFILLLACDAGQHSVADFLPTLEHSPRVVLGLTTQGLGWIGRDGQYHAVTLAESANSEPEVNSTPGAAVEPTAASRTGRPPRTPHSRRRNGTATPRP